MTSCNFCIYENKIFDLNGYEILPDEDNIVTVWLNGMERRFKPDKMIVWLKDSGYKSLFRKPKELQKIKEPKPIAIKVKKVKIVKEPKPKKEKPVKVPKIKKEPKPQYKKVEFDKRKIKGRINKGNPKCRVICSNGETYDSMYRAAAELGITRSQIWHVCNGKWKHTNNLHFSYERATDPN